MSLNSDQGMPKYVNVRANEAAIFDLPQTRLNWVEQCEPYDVLIVPPLKMRYPRLTKFW